MVGRLKAPCALPSHLRPPLAPAPPKSAPAPRPRHFLQNERPHQTHRSRQRSRKDAEPSQNNTSAELDHASTTRRAATLSGKALRKPSGVLEIRDRAGDRLIEVGWRQRRRKLNGAGRVRTALHHKPFQRPPSSTSSASFFLTKSYTGTS